MSIKSNQGQSLFELVVAIGITGLVLVAIMSLAVKSLANATYSKNKTLATRHTQEAMEWLRAQRDISWSVFTSQASPNPGKTYCLSNLSFTSGACGPTIPNTIFTRQAVLVYYSGPPEKVEATVTTSWFSSLDRQHQSRAATVFTNWMID